MRTTLLLAALLLTTTASAQWQIQPAPTTADLRGIHALSNGIAWASGSEGTVLRTTDEGAHWQRCATPPDADHLDFRGIQAFDASTAIVMSSGKGPLSRLYKTTDACQTWTLLFTNPDPEGFWDAIQFSSRDYGVLLGDPVGNIFVVMLTFNGGGKWEQQTLRATEDINGESVFAASNSDLLLSSYPGSRSFCTGGHGGPRVISLGAGPSDVATGPPQKLPWSSGLSASSLPTKQPTFGSSGCFSLAADNRGFGTEVAVGGDYGRPNDHDDNAWTNVFVNSPNPKQMFGFHAAHTPPHGFRSAVAHSPATKSWITVGPNGTDISTDDGRNWRALKPTATEPPDADQHWNALSLPFVVGAHGRIGRLRPATLNAAPQGARP